MSNYLTNESSPYLQQHIKNSLNWYPWGEEALNRAKNEHKPIFLFIGHSACHACHLMEEESFSTEPIKELLNERFIAIKVDKEERPDINKYYQKVYQLMNRRAGGHPLSILLTENLEPFYAASYISPEARQEEFGFEELLRSASKKYITEHETLVERGREIIENVNLKESKIEATKLQMDLTKTIAAHSNHLLDSQHGGFGNSPKFSNASTLMLLLYTYELKEDEKLLDAALFSLNQMIKGGFYDHIDGGFFHYSTDKEWSIPNFTKTTYDNALMVSLYLKAFQITGDFLYQNIALQTIEFISSKMSNSKLFYASLDSHTKKEKEYFSYSYHEVVEQLKAADYSLLDITKICSSLNITQEGNMEGRDVIRVDDPLILKEGYYPDVVKILKKIRQTHPLPFIDKTIITSWNAMMISSLFLAIAVDGSYKHIAIESLEELLQQLYINQTLYHSKVGDNQPKIKGYLEDYAYLGETLIHAYKATSNKKYLKLATEFSNKIIEQFYAHGKWKFSKGEFEIEEEIYDSNYPSSIATALSLLGNIASLVDINYKKFLFRTLEVNSYNIMRQPLSSPKLTEMTLAYLKDDIIIKK